MLLCLAGAAAWAVVAYFAVQALLDSGAEVRFGRSGVLVPILIIAGPPAGLIWLAFSNVIKRACPECSD